MENDSVNLFWDFHGPKTFHSRDKRREIKHRRAQKKKLLKDFGINGETLSDPESHPLSICSTC